MATISHIKGVLVQHLFQRYVIIQKIGTYILLNRMRNIEQYAKSQRIHMIRTTTLNICTIMHYYLITMVCCQHPQIVVVDIHNRTWKLPFRMQKSNKTCKDFHPTITVHPDTKNKILIINCLVSYLFINKSVNSPIQSSIVVNTVSWLDKCKCSQYLWK